MKRLTWLLGLLPAAVLAQGPDEFRGQATLAVPAAGSSHYQFYLPDALYRSGGQPNGRDLRVFNAAGELVPFAVIAPRDQTRQTANWRDVPWFALPESADGSDPAKLAVAVSTDGTLTLRATQSTAAGTARALLLDGHALDLPVDAVDLDWPASTPDLLRTVQVSASDDLVHWRPVGEPQTLARLGQGGRQVRQLRLVWPAEKARYWRLSSNEALPDPSVARLRGLSSATQAWPEVWQTAEGKPLPPAKDQPWRDVAFDLGGAYPVSRIKLVLPEDNLVIPGQLDNRVSERAAWQPGLQSTWFRFPGSPPRQTAALDWQASARYWRLRVDGRQVSLPAKPISLQIAYAPALLVFAARGEPPYRLAWGNPKPSAGDLAPSVLIPGYREDRLPAFPVAKVESVRTSAAPEADPDRDARRTRYLLWALLGLGVLALAGMVWRLSRDMQRKPE